MKNRNILLSSAALLALASPSLAQEAPAPAPPAPSATEAPAPPAATPTPAQAAATQAEPSDDEYGGDEAIVVTGARARGSVVGDIPPENVLTSRDVRATGATNINDLLAALAPQIGSVQGRGGEQPLLLLNGQRISSFRELRDIPTEAIERVEILPEEVALKYGSRPDQKVVNIVLRQRFRSTTAQVGAGVATDGGYANGTGDLTRFMVQRNGRTTLNLHVEGNGMLTEAERDVLLSQPPARGTADQELAARSLLPTSRDLRAGATFNRQIFGDVSATINTEVEHTDGRALVGLGDTLLPLDRNTSSDTAHIGTVFNGTKGNWRWTVTGTGDLDHSVTSTERDPDNAHDRSVETTATGEVKATANGNLFSMPAGNASTTITLDANTVHLDSDRERLGTSSSLSLDRTTGEAAMNIDLPISRRGKDFSALGNLTLNGNAEVDQLSDFGTLTTLGAGANWSPVDRLNFLASWTREEGPPSINQLGDPVLNTPGTRVFDFTTGQTVLVNAITGGNPDLNSDRRHVMKLGANWQPFPNTDLRLRAEYVHQVIDNAIQGLTVTPTIEEAFPDRFVRCQAPTDTDPACTPGQLISADLRPVNFQSTRSDAMRIGFDFSKPLKSHRPSQSVMDQIRAQYRAAGGGGPGGPSGPPPSAGNPPGGGGAGGGFRGGGGGGRGGGFFGGNRGRLTFSLTDNITFVNKAIIAPGLPVIDYLHGDAAGSSGGTPRHQVQAQAGYFNNGLGARLTGNWRSGTTVNTLTGDDLNFSPLATFDLRLFANPGDIPELVVKHPWLRGTQVQLQLNNMFNARPQVRDTSGNVPLSYQPDLLDPLGRTIMISFRKLFAPSPAWFRRQFQQQQQQQNQPTR